MENVEVTQDGDTLVLKIDTSKRLRDSKTGKTTLVATTGGNHQITGTNLKLGLNLFVPK